MATPVIRVTSSHSKLRQRLLTPEGARTSKARPKPHPNSVFPKRKRKSSFYISQRKMMSRSLNQIDQKYIDELRYASTTTIYNTKEIDIKAKLQRQLQHKISAVTEQIRQALKDKTEVELRFSEIHHETHDYDLQRIRVAETTNKTLRAIDTAQAHIDATSIDIQRYTDSLTQIREDIEERRLANKQLKMTIARMRARISPTRKPRKLVGSPK